MCCYLRWGPGMTYMICDVTGREKPDVEIPVWCPLPDVDGVSSVEQEEHRV